MPFNYVNKMITQTGSQNSNSGIYTRTLFGQSIHENPVPFWTADKNHTPFVVFQDPTSGKMIGISKDMLSYGFITIAEPGGGKTNLLNMITAMLLATQESNDKLIIFDTKGDYYSKFYNVETDVTLSTAEKYRKDSFVWNIFSEILVDGTRQNVIAENISEIAYGLFSEAISKNNSNPFFPNAARDLFASILTCLYRKTGDSEDLKESYLNNRFLKKYLDSLNVRALRELLKNQPDQIAVMNYVGDGNNDQGLGVFAELQSVIRKIFVGAFADKGNFSIRRFVRERKARTLFIEYDLTRGATLTPIYKLLIDLALKEAMCRSEGERGNVYVFCDEFKLLPDLIHIENAVNFGRSLGLKVFAGLQSIEQITENYGEARGKNIIAGFSSVF